eukprot:jgi/Tetstr1/446065/TSEL_033667.t1
MARFLSAGAARLCGRRGTAVAPAAGPPPWKGALLSRPHKEQHAVRCASLSAERPPAFVGADVAEVETPALLVDLDALEANCRSLKHRMEAYPTVSIRPHCKAHKCAEIAKLQMELLGATGVCCQKLAEVEAMVEGGVTDILLSNELVSPPKISRLAAMAAGGAKLSLCVDDLGNVAAVSEAAARAGAEIELLVDCNVGQDRCGVDEPEDALRLAEAILAAPGVTFGGIQAYHGGIQHVRGARDRAGAVAAVADRTRRFVDCLTARSLPLASITGAGTGTFEEHAASGVFTEVQPGSFCFGDADYARNLRPDGSAGGEWEQSLWVLASVMSRNEAHGRAVLDAGTKAVSLDSGPPLVPEAQTGGVTVEYRGGGDEHGVLLWPEVWQVPTELPPVGAVLKLMPGHCDPTVNLYDWIVATRGDRVEAVWQIRGRGPGL